MTTNLCPCCGKSMRRFEQKSFNPAKPIIVLEDCQNPNCRIPGVTLEAGKHAQLTPAEIDQYADSIAQYQDMIARDAARKAEDASAIARALGRMK